MNRFTDDQVATWRREGALLLPRFFFEDEVAPVRADFERLFTAQRVVDPKQPAEGEDAPSFRAEQFAGLKSFPLACSPALNLIGLHPALVALARAALGTHDVRLYQCDAWAKFTGDADYAQPFHCDYVNHTLLVPAEARRDNCITIISYFSDVSEAHGPMHYVPRSQSDALGGIEADADDPAVQAALASHACSTAAPAGSAFAYTIDTYHRATNMTAQGGHRYAVMACYKAAANERIASRAWPAMFTQPWNLVFANATPDQLACIGVPPPGDAFWTRHTLRAVQRRYPDWDLAAWRAASSAA